MPSRYAHLFEHPQGPGDARPTALQIVRDEGLTGALADKVFLVTGTSSGIGIETARALAATGGRVFCTARDTAKGEAALAGILAPGRVELVHMDNDSLASVRAGAAEVLRRSGGRLNVLVANAGIMMCPEGKTADGFEKQFGTNHLAHFLLFQLVRDALLASSTPEFNSRVVMVSSMGHAYGPLNIEDLNFAKGGYTPGAAYGNSKTANIYMANQIERLYGAKGLHATSLHPGGIATGLQVHMPAETKAKWAANKDVVNYMSSPAQGAANSVLTAVGKDWEGTGGEYLEFCDIAKPVSSDPKVMGGAAPYVKNPEVEQRLWKDSLEMVGLPSA